MPWYSYKCRFEALYDFGQFFYCLEDEKVKFMNNKIKQVDTKFEWEFESNYILEDLKKLMMTINKKAVMYESLNYKPVYTGDKVLYEHLRQLMFQ